MISCVLTNWNGNATTDFTASPEPCNCNVTGCPHSYTFRVSYTVEPVNEELPHPRPWIVERVPVIPRFQSNDAMPWRPTRQRAREGTIVRHKTGGLWKTV
jgi:hypothetical protein